MKQIVVTIHDSYIIAYAHMFPKYDSLVEYVKSIYIDFYDTKNPMYVFFKQHTIVLYPISKNTTDISILEHARIFSSMKYPDKIPKKHNIHTFELDPDNTINKDNHSHTINKSSNENLIKELTSAIELYNSDLYKKNVPFCVVYCEKLDFLDYVDTSSHNHFFLCDI